MVGFSPRLCLNLSYLSMVKVEDGRSSSTLFFSSLKTDVLALSDKTAKGFCYHHTMDSLPAFLALSLLLLNSIASAQSRICDADVLSGRDPSNQFQFPPPSCAPGNYNGISSYTQGTSLTIHWACTISPVNVAIIQQGAQDPIAILARKPPRLRSIDNID